MTHTMAVFVAVIVGVVVFVVAYKVILSRSAASMVAVVGGLVTGGAAAAVTYVAFNPTAATGPIALTTCPNHNFTDLLWKDSAGDERKVFKIVGDIGNIPEFHDCQKLIAPGSGGVPEYGATVAIFATTLGSQPPTQSTPVIAVVFTMGGSYPALGINMQLDQPYGINCLYLFSSSVGQNAKMVGPVSQDAKCSDTNIVSQAGTPLWVLASTPNPNVPAVARWDYDSSAKLNYIGIKCGDAWCEIGGDNSIKVSGTIDPSSVNPTLTSTVAVKGWYDQQLLAVMDSAGTGLELSGVTGTLIPAPGLGAFVNASFDSFKEVATAIVDKPYNKLDLEPGENTISLCKGSGATCTPDDPSALDSTKCSQGWWARIRSVSASGLAKITYHCVLYTEHSSFGANAPGTARWRWVDKDEHMWMRCSTGCCEVY